MIILLGELNKLRTNTIVMPLDWSSGKLNRIVTSTYKAESIALTFATEKAV